MRGVDLIPSVPRSIETHPWGVLIAVLGETGGDGAKDGDVNSRPTPPGAAELQGAGFAGPGQRFRNPFWRRARTWSAAAVLLRNPKCAAISRKVGGAVPTSAAALMKIEHRLLFLSEIRHTVHLDSNSGLWHLSNVLKPFLMGLRVI